jgi:hypothetical protein
MSHIEAPQATAHACLRAALVAGAADMRAHGLVALILALLLRLLDRTALAWDLLPEDAEYDEFDKYGPGYAPWQYAEGRHALIVPPMGRAPHAACIEAGLVPDWVLPCMPNRGMRPRARTTQEKPSPLGGQGWVRGSRAPPLPP